MPSPILTDRLLALLRQRCRPRGRCSVGWADLVWSLAEQHPNEPRPRLHEVTGALDALRETGRIETRMDPSGRRTCVLAG